MSSKSLESMWKDLFSGYGYIYNVSANNIWEVFISQRRIQLALYISNNIVGFFPDTTTYICSDQKVHTRGHLKRGMRGHKIVSE